jgi:hypothetical protein
LSAGFAAHHALGRVHQQFGAGDAAVLILVHAVEFVTQGDREFLRRDRVVHVGVGGAEIGLGLLVAQHQAAPVGHLEAGDDAALVDVGAGELDGDRDLKFVLAERKVAVGVHAGEEDGDGAGDLRFLQHRAGTLAIRRAAAGRAGWSGCASRHAAKRENRNDCP